MQGLDCYRTYLAMKQHFTNPKFDFFKYDGKVKAREEKYQETHRLLLLRDARKEAVGSRGS